MFATSEPFLTQCTMFRNNPVRNTGLAVSSFQVSDSTSKDLQTALQAFLSSATSVGYQLSTSGSQGKPLPDHSLVNIEVRVRD